MNGVELLVDFRHRTGLSYPQLGEILGVEASTAGNWCRGKHGMPRDIVTTVKRLASDPAPKLSPKVTQATKKALHSALKNGNSVSYGIHGQRTKYPWSEMAIGESFSVACSGDSVRKVRNSLTSCRGHVSRKTGRKFDMRRTLEGLKIVRVA